MRIRWHITTVERAGYLATRSSLAFSPSGKPAIAYYSSFNNALRFATLRDDGTWDIATVDTVFSDCKPSLAFRFGQPAISYRVGDTDENGELRYALLTGGNPPWSINTVARSANASSLAFNSHHDASISYFDPQSKTLKLVTQGANPSVWTGQTVDPTEGVGDFNSLAFTPLSGIPFNKPADRPAIAYHAHATPFDLIKYAVFDGSAWHRQTVWQGRGSCSLAFTLAGTPYISVPGLSGGLQVMMLDPSWGWIGLGGARPGNHGAVASSPTPAFRWGMSYQDGHLIYAHGQGVGLTPGFLVEEAGKNQAGELIGPFEWTSLAFSPEGQPAISYYDTANYTIKYAVGRIFRTPIDDLISFVTDLIFRIRRSARRTPKPVSGGA